MKQGLFTLGLSVALSIMAGCRSQQEGWKLVWVGGKLRPGGSFR